MRSSTGSAKARTRLRGSRRSWISSLREMASKRVGLINDRPSRLLHQRHEDVLERRRDRLDALGFDPLLREQFWNARARRGHVLSFPQRGMERPAEEADLGDAGGSLQRLHGARAVARPHLEQRLAQVLAQMRRRVE